MKSINVRHDIFSVATVEQAVSVYQGLASISVRYGEDCSEVVFADCRYDEERTVKEFENYLIGVENS